MGSLNTINVGRIRPHFLEDEYDSTTTYKFYDTVLHNRDWWLHIKKTDTTGVEPTLTNSDTWARIGIHGTDGYGILGIFFEDGELKFEVGGDDVSTYIDDDGNLVIVIS